VAQQHKFFHINPSFTGQIETNIRLSFENRGCLKLKKHITSMVLVNCDYTRSHLENADHVQGPRLNLAGFHILIILFNVFNKRGPIRRRLKSYGGTGPPSLKSYGGTGEKAQSRLRRDEQYILRRFATPKLGACPPKISGGVFVIPGLTRNPPFFQSFTLLDAGSGTGMTGTN
jgi:hypothetical protein